MIMKSKNILLNSLAESFSAIWKNKLFFLLLFVLEVIFLSALFYVSITYIPKMLESAQAMTDYMNQQKFDDLTVASNILHQKSILGDDPLAITRNFNEITKNFRIYFAYVFILLAIFLSVSWIFTFKFINKSNLKISKKILFGILAVVLFYIAIIFALFHFLLNISILEAAYDTSKIFIKYALFVLFTPIIAYFMYISLSLSYNTDLKDIVQKTLGIGIRKIHYMLVIYFINIFLFIISVYLISYFIDRNFFIVFFSIILMISGFIFGRIFLITSVKKLSEN